VIVIVAWLALRDTSDRDPGVVPPTAEADAATTIPATADASIATVDAPTMPAVDAPTSRADASRRPRKPDARLAIPTATPDAAPRVTPKSKPDAYMPF
jgi:hypothetical protein